LRNADCGNLKSTFEKQIHISILRNFTCETFLKLHLKFFSAFRKNSNKIILSKRLEVR